MPTIQKFIFHEATHAPAPTASIAIDVVDACNLACVTCIRGRRTMKNHRGQMPLGLFENIITKAASLGFYHVCLYNWTEPFLCKNLQDYTKIVKNHGLFCQLSSNLSFPSIPQLLPTLENCDRLIVSVSGFTQPVYGINHRGGRIEQVKKQLEIIGEALALGHIHTKVDIRYFMYPHTEPEYEKFREFGEALGFNVLAWQGLGDPVSARRGMTPGTGAREFSLDRPPGAPYVSPSSTEVCYKSIAPFNVDLRGDSYLCCVLPNTPATKIGNFLEESLESQLFKRVTHPLCHGCTLKDRVAVAPHTMECLLKGQLECYGMAPGVLHEIAREAAIADELAGQEVYFWGSGGMLRRKMHVFHRCRPVCILTESPDAPEKICDLPVRSPWEALRDRRALPVVIFAGNDAREIIEGKIASHWPWLTEVYHCSAE